MRAPRTVVSASRCVIPARCIRIRAFFLPPGRPKAKKAPSGGSKRASACAAWGHFLPPGRPKARRPRQKKPPFSEGGTRRFTIVGPSHPARAQASPQSKLHQQCGSRTLKYSALPPRGRSH
ncbi:hypothetical protein CSC67_17525 [Pusillimonas caeni]|nr:hypothetical protein CSC67_17525 [Pusillimonas caeni]